MNKKVKISKETIIIALTLLIILQAWIYHKQDIERENQSQKEILSKYNQMLNKSGKIIESVQEIPPIISDLKIEEPEIRILAGSRDIKSGQNIKNYVCKYNKCILKKEINEEDDYYISSLMIKVTGGKVIDLRISFPCNFDYYGAYAPDVINNYGVIFPFDIKVLPTYNNFPTIVIPEVAEDKFALLDIIYKNSKKINCTIIYLANEVSTHKLNISI